MVPFVKPARPKKKSLCAGVRKNVAMKTILPITVVAFETDYGGVVSNTRYLEYIERGRYALLHASNLKIEDIWKTHRVQPVVRHVSIEYLGFARHEDDLELEIHVSEHGRTFTTLNYELRRIGSNPDTGAMLMRATQTLAYINANWRPTRVPEIFKNSLPAS
jgi:YbgC/YbaW family acyl-CoA thioester hydrolase